jgi:hypothetical protein
VTVTQCGQCQRVLDEASDLEEAKRTPCPSCGSLSRSFGVCVHDTVRVSTRMRLRGKRAGAKKPFVERVSGKDFSAKLGRDVDLERVIDRDSDLYQETVVDPQTGETLHSCTEPLSQHIGHGSAKPARREDDAEKEGGLAL